jgi:SNF2 family DNA or RNA helicase
MELYSLLAFLDPKHFNSIELWKDLFTFSTPSVSLSALKARSTATSADNSRASTPGITGKEAEEKWNEMKSDFVASQLHEILRPLMLRRLKTDVELTLPLKKESVPVSSWAGL